MINLDKLCELLRTNTRYDGQSDFNSIPLNGVYVMYERGELTPDGKERIVRVGINEQQDCLRERIRSHYKGTIRRSVFRKHIGSSLSIKNGSPVTESQISEYIQKNISFTVIEESDKSIREQLEKMLIATIANDPQTSPSANWLGKYCTSPKISHEKLWNVNFLCEKPLTEEHEKLILSKISGNKN